MLRAFGIGFLGAVAALMVAVAVWFAAFQPIDRPVLVWGGNVYTSKDEFALYLKIEEPFLFDVAEAEPGRSSLGAWYQSS